MSKISK